MTTPATFNGKPTFSLPGATIIRGLGDDRHSTYRIWSEPDEGSGWTLESVQLGVDPSQTYADSIHADLVAAYWASADALVLLGSQGAVIVDRMSGSVRLRIEPVFTGQSSLDVAALMSMDDGRLLVVSSRRVWLVVPNLMDVREIRPRYLLASPPLVRAGELIFEEFDLDDPSGGMTKEHIAI